MSTRRTTRVSDFSQYVHNLSVDNNNNVQREIESQLAQLDLLGFKSSEDDEPPLSQQDLKAGLIHDCDVDLAARYLCTKLDKSGRNEALISLCGDIGHVSVDEYQRAVTTIKQAAKDKVGANVTSIGESHEKQLLLVQKKRKQENQPTSEVRIAVVGNVDAGKSTMLGVLTKGVLDDGRGKARVDLFRHKHERESGRTSSVGMEIMGFDLNGNVVRSPDPQRKLSWTEVIKNSEKIATFVDLAGHEKYLRTTIFGLMGGFPDYVMLMVGANAGIIGMAKEHLGIALSLNVPIFVCITKIDMCPANVLNETLAQLKKLVKSPGCRKVPVQVSSCDDIADCLATFSSGRVCPIFHISNVTGVGVEYLTKFINGLPLCGGEAFNQNAPFLFYINETFSVPFVGTVVSGVIKQGTISRGDSIYMGPDSLGNFMVASVRSIEWKRQQIDKAIAGQSVAIALKRVKRSQVRKGMVLTLYNPQSIPKAHYEFLAEVLILQHSSTIRIGYNTMLHVGPIAQTCKIIDIQKHDCIRTGDRAMVQFRFTNRPEYLQVHQKILFREGRTKGLGIIKQVY